MSALTLKNLWREIRAIDQKRSCVCLICPSTFAGAGIWSVDVDRVLIRLTKLIAASWIFKDKAAQTSIAKRHQREAKQQAKATAPGPLVEIFDEEDMHEGENVIMIKFLYSEPFQYCCLCFFLNMCILKMDKIALHNWQNYAPFSSI